MKVARKEAKLSIICDFERNKKDNRFRLSFHINIKKLMLIFYLDFL
jgi:hypothetical protein